MPTSAFIDDDMEEMEVDEADDDFDFGEVREALPQRERQQTNKNNLLPPGQRGANHNEMFQLIQQGVNYSAKIVDLLSKGGNAEQIKRMETLIGRLAKFDRDFDIDRRAIDETNRIHSKDNSDKRIIHNHFKNIRETLHIDNPGRNQQDIERISSRLTNYTKQTEQAAQRNINENNSIIEEADGNDDDDMEMLNHYISDKDPITKKRIREPVKNPICEHVYDRDSIQEHINFQKSRRQLYQCPVQRCSNKQLLKMEQLMPFPEFFQLVHRARSRSRAANSTRCSMSNSNSEDDGNNERV